jgi:predicted component of type VI protein secretion system
MFMRVQSLQMLQQGLLERIEELRRFQQHYPYGIIEAQVASDALAAGKVRFSRLHAVLPNGLEMVVPEECELPALPVREAIARSRSGEVTVMLGVPDYATNGQNTFRLGEVPNSQVNFRYVPRDEQRADENTGENKQPIIVRTLHARLLFEHESKSGLEVMPLLKVRKASAGTGTEFRVELVPGFAPPCLYLPPPALSAEERQGVPPPSGGEPELSLPHRLAEEVYLSVQRVEVARRQLSARMQDQHLGRGALEGVQFQKWIRLLALSRHAARMLALQRAPRTTPFEMFLALYEALRELEASQPRRNVAAGRGPQDTSLEYNHEDAFAVFSRLRSRLEKALVDIGGVEFYEAAFEPDSASPNRVRAVLRQEFFGNNIAAWYLAVQTPLAVSVLIPVLENRMNFELTTPDRIGTSWGGLKLRHQPNSPPGLPNEPDLYYFQVEQSADAVLRQLWAEVSTGAGLAIDRSNPHLNLSDAVFKFYAILQPTAYDADNPE